MKVKNILIVLLIILLGSRCYKEMDVVGNGNEIDTPDWTETTHGKSAEPDYQTVFNQQEVLRFDLVFDSDDWETMQTDLSSNIGTSFGPPGQFSSFDPVWVPCSVFFNGLEWYKVGVRYKGNSSLRSTYQNGNHKLSFKLDFDQFEDDYPAINNQRFYGFKQLNLKNNFDDQSLIREKVGSDLFRNFGLASPQCSFAAVYVDYGEGVKYFGLYTLVEEVDDTVLDSQFGNDNGNLYKPDGTGASFRSGSYEDSQMEKKNNEDEANYTDVKSLYDILNSNLRTSDTETWMNSLEKVLDVPNFINWLAANTVMQNWDTYGRMTHNYYLYNDPSTELLTWIPWDNNEALQFGKQGGALSLSLDEVNQQWPLIRYIMDVEEYAGLYEKATQRFVTETFDPTAMGILYDQYQQLLQPYADAEEEGYTFIQSTGGFTQAISTLKEHVNNRYNAVIGAE